MQYNGFVFGSYESQAYTADFERTVNWFPERLESTGGTSKWALYPTPGVSQLSIAANGIGRGHFQAAGREFAVIGTSLIEIDKFGTQTVRGTVAINSSPATFAYNGDGGDQLFVTSGTNGYIMNLSTNVVTQITALNGKATMGGQMDGYFIALDAATSTFYISNLLAGLTWTTGTDFAQRSKMPDPWVAMKVNPPYIWLFGTETTEVWYNTGQSFPFAPHPSGLIGYGCDAPFAVALVGSALVWPGTSVAGGVYVLQASGFTPEVVSSVPQQFAMSGYATTSDAVADSYTDLGHTFYVLTFPSEDVTWAWDVTTGQWTERATWIAEQGQYIAWRPRWHAYVFNEHRMLDYDSPAVYRMSYTDLTDVDERVIRRLRRAPTMMAENTRVYYSAMEVDLQPATVVDPASNAPQVMLRFSNDGGKNWSPEMFRGAGKVGEYGTRIRWNRLGMGRRRIFEVAVSDTTQWRLTNAYLALGQAPAKQGAA